MVREPSPVKGAHAPLWRLVAVATLVLAAIVLVRGPRATWRVLTGTPGVVPVADALVLDAAPFGTAIRTGELGHPALDEASGLAVSPRQTDLLWVVNDSGSPPRLFAVGTGGQDRGVVDVAGARNVDWEDLAAFELDGTAYLLAADVGDNAARRRSVTLYVIEEPVLAGDRLPPGATASVAWAIELVYEDGPLDCEAVAVDAAAGRVLLVSKRTVPARLYEVPLRPTPSSPVTAARVAEIPFVPLPTVADVEEDPEFGAFRSQITALDVAARGDELVAITYKDAYRFVRSEGESWAEAVARRPQRITLPRMAQTEAGAYGAGGATLFVTSERRPSPLFRLDRMAPPVVAEMPPAVPDDRGRLR